jgi:AAA+ ATPase superfamily predicted ATPase
MINIIDPALSNKRDGSRILGREIEIAKLTEAFDSNEAEFIALYGRRRVGKTYLVSHYFLSKECLFFHTTGIQNAPLQDQLYAFTRTLESTFLPPNMILKEPTSWIKAFELLTTLMKEQNPQTKIVLFFDEMPWFATPKSGFLQAFNYYWNRHWVNRPTIKLVVCGSATSWMLKNILNNKGGLHNRVTLRLPIDPFTLAETKSYLTHKGFSYTDRQICDLYMIIGGIPYYLNCLTRKQSVPQNIDEICFNKKGGACW